MSPLYQEEPKKLDIIAHLEELRRRILICLFIVAVFTVLAFWKGEYLLEVVKKPIAALVPELIFITPTEAFLAYLKVSLLCGAVLSFPVVVFHVWAFLNPALAYPKKRRVLVWLILAVILFFGGILFSCLVAIPAALSFLIGFGERIARPAITLGRYISFYGAFILTGGIIFEIPVGIGLLSDIGLVAPDTLRSKRPHAFLAIMVLAAVITPTQDIFNMLLFAIPMMLLFELGILLATFIGKYAK